MFTKKLEDQFSADLLNTVKGILDEAKHKKDCECEKCEKEDDEEEDEDEEKEMKEGFASAAQRVAEGVVPTADEPTEHDKKMAQKVRDLLAKEKKPVKEEARGDITVKKISTADAFKKHIGQAMKKASVPKDPKTGKTLYQKVTSEETDLEEGMAMWKVEFPKQHAGKAVAAGSAHVKAQNVSHAHKVMAKRLGVDHKIFKSNVKKASILPEEVELDEAINTMSDARIKYHATKNIPHGKYSPKEIDAEHKRRMKAVPNYHTVKASLGEEAEQIDELSKDTLKSYLDKKKVPSGTVVANTNDKDSMRKYTNRVVGGVRAAKKLTKEEAEQLDELSPKTLGSYVKRASTQAFGKGYTGGSMMVRGDMNRDKEEENIGKKTVDKGVRRLAGISKATDKLTKEEQEFIDSLNAMELDEGRGRPPKEGSAAWHAKLKQDNDDMPALGMQLRKAKSMNKKVRFMDGKEHEVSPHHADKFEDHMAARKTSQEKAAFQKQAHKSHSEFVKAVTAPVPKATKDTGEIVKYRH